MKFVKFILILLFVASPAISQDHGLTATQVIVGVNRTALIKNINKPNRSEFNVSVLAVVPLPKKLSLQVQYIDNLQGGRLVRTGVAFNATSLIKKLF